MGYRIIEIPLLSPPSPAYEAFLGQVVAFAEHHGIDAPAAPPASYPGVWEITFQGNSSFLNDMTAYICEEVPRIAEDIDSSDYELGAVADLVTSQLRSQIVDWGGGYGVMPARKGRELDERIGGESSFAYIGAELKLASRRITEELEEHASVAGKTAWRRRKELELAIRVDVFTLLGAARRLRRVAEDLCDRIGGLHLEAAVAAFSSATTALITLRDIAEHIDEYGVGTGRIDKVPLEPGEVFELKFGKDDVSISARGRTIHALSTSNACTKLIGCLQEATDHHSVRLLFPGIADFDFVEETPTGPRLIDRQDETGEHAEFRAMIATSLRRDVEPAMKHCGTCGQLL